LVLFLLEGVDLPKAGLTAQLQEQTDNRAQAAEAVEIVHACMTGQQAICRLMTEWEQAPLQFDGRHHCLSVDLVSCA
jgi:hypothetical protein